MNHDQLLMRIRRGEKVAVGLGCFFVTLWIGFVGLVLTGLFLGVKWLWNNT